MGCYKDLYLGLFYFWYTVEQPLSNDPPHQRPSHLYDHILRDGQCVLFVPSLTDDHPSDATNDRVRWDFLPRERPPRLQCRPYFQESRVAVQHPFPSSRVCHHTSRAQFSSHVLVLTSSSISPWIPSGWRWMGQSPLVIWSAVCSAPQSQQSLVESPQRSIFAPNLPTPVRILFSRVQARRDRPTPCPLFGGVGMNLCSLVVVDAHDSAHLARVQCFTVSCGETEDTSC